MGWLLDCQLRRTSVCPNSSSTHTSSHPPSVSETRIPTSTATALLRNITGTGESNEPTLRTLLHRSRSGPLLLCTSAATEITFIACFWRLHYTLFILKSIKLVLTLIIWFYYRIMTRKPAAIFYDHTTNHTNICLNFANLHATHSM